MVRTFTILLPEALDEELLRLAEYDLDADADPQVAIEAALNLTGGDAEQALRLIQDSLLTSSRTKGIAEEVLGNLAGMSL